MTGDLGPHAAFIAAAYAVAVILVGGLCAWIMRDHGRLSRQLAALDKRRAVTGGDAPGRTGEA